jgi:hypothetical protein
METKAMTELNCHGADVESVTSALRLLSRQRRKAQRKLLRHIEEKLHDSIRHSESYSNENDYLGEIDDSGRKSTSSLIGSRRNRQKTQSVSSSASNYSNFFPE